jgi:hypothetical protein
VAIARMDIARMANGQSSNKHKADQNWVYVTGPPIHNPPHNVGSENTGPVVM